MKQRINNDAMLAKIYNVQFNCTLEIKSRNAAMNAGINIEEEALEILESLGFDPEKKGTEFLAELVDSVYHERYGSYSDDFYNFDIFDNQHFLNMGEYHECGIKPIRQEIAKSIQDIKVDNGSYTSLILSIAENLIETHEKEDLNIVRQKVYQK